MIRYLLPGGDVYWLKIDLKGIGGDSLEPSSLTGHLGDGELIVKPICKRSVFLFDSDVC